MKEVHHQKMHAQQNNNNNRHSTAIARTSSRAEQRRELTTMIKSKSSLISIDGLLDGLSALVLDCEPMRKNKNIDNFLCRCNYLKS
jgi:hypothetical protein